MTEIYFLEDSSPNEGVTWFGFSSEALFDFYMAAFFLWLHMAFLLCVGDIISPSYEDTSHVVLTY